MSEREYALKRLAECRAELAAQKQVLMYCGRKVEDITDRDELLAVVYTFASQLAAEQRWNRQCFEMEQVFDDARRTIGATR